MEALCFDPDMDGFYPYTLPSAVAAIHTVMTMRGPQEIIDDALEYVEHRLREADYFLTPAARTYGRLKLVQAIENAAPARGLHL